MPQPALVPVVAVALVDQDGRVLMQQRRHGGRHGGLWEFPGGKVEQGETPELALAREAGEELGVVLGPLVPAGFASDPCRDPSRREPYLILLYLCRAWTGEPRCLEGEAIAWFAPAELAGLPMPPLDVPLAAALPRVLANAA